MATLGLALGLACAPAAWAAAPLGQTIWLRAVANSQYVSADQSAVNTPLRANRATAGAWEQFVIVDAGGGVITIRSVGNNLYVSADQNLANVPLVANRAAPQGWEQFRWIEPTAGQVQLQSVGNNMYVSADANLDAVNVPLVANRPAPSGWETYTWGVVGSATPTPTPTPSSTYVEVTPGGGSVTASANDGNLPANSVDNSLATRWSANGDGQWITFDLGTARTVGHVGIAFYSGNVRQSRFDLQVSPDNAAWTNVITGGLSSGTTTAEQTFDFTDSSARYIRYLGHGNTVNPWNSLQEVSIFATGGTGPTPTPTPTPVGPTPTPTPTPVGPTPTQTATPTPTSGPTNLRDVLTRAYDNQRTGANTLETTLNQSNVTMARFGKRFTITVDDQIYAQPLIVSNLSIGGTTRNVIFIATMNNTVYAFDADFAGGLGAPVPLWQRNFNNGARPTSNSEVGQQPTQTWCNPYVDIRGNTGIAANVGVVGTPVIDGNSRTLYVVTRTVEGGAHIQRLRAIDIVTGNERVPATTISGINKNSNQRPALALSQNKVYVAWASFCDVGPYNGRVTAFDTGSLAQVATWNVTPNGTEGGIWMSGHAPAIDGSGNVFYVTGNGTFDNANNFGESVVRLSPTLAVQDWFTPSNWQSLNDADQDLGSGGPTLIPGSSRVVTGGKDGNCFVVNTASLGRVGGQVQAFRCVDPTNARPGQTHNVHNGMVAWRDPNNVMQVYSWGENDFGRRWTFNGSTLTTPANSVTTVIPPLGMPGGMISLSSNGSQAGSGVLWATMPLSGDANHETVPGVLRAFSAENLTQQLWNSTLTTADNTMNFAKGSPPVVANGKVYVASLSNAVSIYGPAQADEAETAVVADATAGRLIRAFVDTNMSGGNGSIMEAHAAGEFVSFTIDIPRGGNYGIRVRQKKANNRGIWQLSIDGVNQGAAQDGFVAGTATTYVEADLGTRALTAGNHTYRFQLTGKNASASDFWLSFDYIKTVER